ncbi:hypothetical protein FQN54_003610 [Arachnomyces sp. PD_36]|nr:hypothetical protein FQN54_003610 [Arachnomyces sp. PD_36]
MADPVGLSGEDITTVIVEGLQKSEGAQSPDTQEYTECVRLSKDALLPELWSKLASLGYRRPDLLEQGEKRYSRSSKKLCLRPCETIEVVQDKPSEKGKFINIDDPLIAFANRAVGSEFKLDIDDIEPFSGATSKDALRSDCGYSMTFHRTVRMPDDDKLHQLPGSLGSFPVYNVSAYADKLPKNIVQRGGVFLPMWQREALWIEFNSVSSKNYALRVSVGGINAVSGNRMDESRDESASAIKGPVQDYVVVPGQQWLDGICVAPGVVRQFVAMPLGAGYTVEGQKTGEEKHGGLQIEIIPAYQIGLKVWLPEATEDETVETIDSYRRRFDEQWTPSELGLSHGSKIRAFASDPKYFPPNPTYFAYYAISDLAKNTSDRNAQIKAFYQPPAGGKGLPPVYGRGRPPGSGRGLPHPGLPAFRTEHDTSRTKIATKNLKAMGLAAGGKLVQDIYRDRNPPRIWNTEATRLVHVHILDPQSCESVTHIVPPPPPIDAMGYVEQDLPFFVVEEQVDNRVDGGEFKNVASVSAMDKKTGVMTEPSFDPSKPTMCTGCETRLCDCIVRPCNHQFCNVCIRKLEKGDESDSREQIRRWKCPICSSDVSHVAGFSAPMNLPGEEGLKAKVPVHVLKVEDGRVAFKSIQRTRI